MPLIIKHNFVSGLADGSDATQVQPSHWNDDHTLSGSLAIAQVDGLQTALDAKVSSASLVTALGSYLTSASAALGTYITSASLATALAPYITSASLATSATFGSMVVGGTASFSATVNIRLRLTVGDGTGNAVIATDGQAGASNRGHFWQTSGSTRWAFITNATAESGGNVGSDLELRAYDDSASLIFTLATYSRSGGTITFGQTVVFNGTATFSAFARTLAGFDVSATASVGVLRVAGNAKVSATLSVGVLQIAGTTFTPGDYLTSNSFSAAIAAYITSASVATALAPYLTSASAALSTYVTSSSLATALDLYLTSASAALSTYVTSNSLSAAVATAALTVAGATTLSATAHLNTTPVYVTDGGAKWPMSGPVLLHESSIGAAAQSWGISGSWTNVAMFDIHFYTKANSASGTTSLSIYTDGGTTPFMSLGSATMSGGFAYARFTVRTASGWVHATQQKLNAGTAMQVYETGTQNANVINFLRIASGASVTLSSGFVQVWGYLR